MKAEENATSDAHAWVVYQLEVPVLRATHGHVVGPALVDGQNEPVGQMTEAAPWGQ